MVSQAGRFENTKLNTYNKWVNVQVEKIADFPQNPSTTKLVGYFGL